MKNKNPENLRRKNHFVLTLPVCPSKQLPSETTKKEVLYKNTISWKRSKTRKTLREFMQRNEAGKSPTHLFHTLLRMFLPVSLSIAKFRLDVCHNSFTVAFLYLNIFKAGGQ